MSLNKVIQLTNEFCNVLTEMERAGIPVDLEALDDLERETNDRILELEIKLDEIASKVMGDTPINFKSTEQLSRIIYSRVVKDKKRWKEEIGFYPKQNKFEVMRIRNQMTKKRFIWLVKNYMDFEYKTVKQVCSRCKGSGKQKSDTQNRMINCKLCGALGVEYIPTDKVAGLKVTPTKDYLIGDGFTASKDIVEELLKRPNLNNKAREFLTALDEYRKLNSYLANGIKGIRKGLVKNILHSTFNQSIARTARLTSSNPNAQNMPRGNTFPIKKVFVSKWEEGVIIDGDMGQLEFRMAAYLAGCKKAEQDIIDGVDIHRVSASKIFNVTEDEVTKEQRQLAKSETFAPLFGASKDWGLLDRYPKIRAWHQELINEAVNTNQIVLPTGRVYKFPSVRRTAYGCTNQTKIKNYPVQGMSGADLVPAIIVELFNRLKPYESYICSTIHDSIIVDVHPAEYAEVLPIVYEVMNDGNNIMKKRFGLNITVPLVADVKVGKNGYNTKEVKYG